MASEKILVREVPVYSEKEILKCVEVGAGTKCPLPKPVCLLVFGYVDDQPEFIRGRKVQLLLDRWSLDGKVQEGRAETMLKLLPELTSTETKLNTNVDHILVGLGDTCGSNPRTNGANDLSSCPLDLAQISMPPTEQFELGKAWQFLLDTDQRRWMTTTLYIVATSVDGIAKVLKNAKTLRKRIASGYFKGRIPKSAVKRLQESLNKVDIINCRDSKCRVAYGDGYNVHCETCYGELTIQDIHNNPNPAPPLLSSRSVKQIQCSGLGCRIHKQDGRGLHCTSCYGSDSEDSDDDY